MFGIFTSIVGVLSVLFLMRTGHPVLLGVAVISALVNIGTWILMGIQSSMIKESRDHDGPDFLSDVETDQIPNWISYLSILSSFISFILLISGIVIRFA